MRDAINSLLSQANRATEMIQKDGPELISSLTDQYVTETVEIIDEFKFFVSSALTVSLLKASFFAWSTYVFKKS